MPEQIDLERLLARNPGVDGERLRKSIAAAKTRRTPRRRPGFNIVLPFGSRQLRVAKEKTEKAL